MKEVSDFHSITQLFLYGVSHVVMTSLAVLHICSKKLVLVSVEHPRDFGKDGVEGFTGKTFRLDAQGKH